MRDSKLRNNLTRPWDTMREAREGTLSKKTKIERSPSKNEKSWYLFIFHLKEVSDSLWALMLFSMEKRINELVIGIL